MIWAKAQAGTAPYDIKSPQGCSHRRVPGSPAKLGIGRLDLNLKLFDKFLYAIRQPLNRNCVR
jgi:hypothetical protein